jgi:hypothetical protein
MTFDDFKVTLSGTTPPSTLSPVLQALWYDGKGDWEKAHGIAQEANSVQHSWIHAYLHRKEGDNWNANYWYTRAGKQMPEQSLEEEWEAIVKAFLS